MSGVPPMLVEHQKADFPAPDADLSGLTAVVTGSNVGLGYETVAHLMRMKASRIIMAVRSIEKGEKAKAELLARRGDYAGSLQVWELDMASFDSVKAFASRCKQDLDRIDMTILNAGMATLAWRTTKDGWEETLQVNVLSTGLLALLLLPQMQSDSRSTFNPHLVIVSSGAHLFTTFPCRTAPYVLEALNDRSLHDPMDRYNVTKLLDIFITREIAGLPAAADIAVYSTNPGLCMSQLTREFPREMLKAFEPHAWTAEKGARTIVHAAVTDDVTSGGYIEKAAQSQPSQFTLSEEGQQAQRKVWKEMTNIWLKESPDVARILAE